MKRINIALCSLMLLGLLFSCSKASLNYTQDGNWVSRAIFKGIPMGNGACFTIGDTAYVGTGYNPQDPNNRLNVMYKYGTTPIPATVTGYDSAYGSWSQVAEFAGGGRAQAVAFTANGAGYLGAGAADARNVPLNDFYRYDPWPVNAWTRVADLADPTGKPYPRFDAVSFSMDSVAYVLTGTDNLYYFGDVWKYSPASNSWTQYPDMPGSKRKQAVTWVYKGEGYLLSGFTPGSQWTQGNACYDFWKFSPNSTGNQWTRLHDIANTDPGTFDDSYTNIVRYHAVGFTILGTATGDKGYITTGTNGTVNNFTWEYDFSTQLWTEKTPFEGSAREGAVGFTLKNRGFVATGVNGGTAYDDCREFFPNQIYNQYD